MNWKEKIEAQIAYLTTMLGVQSQQRSKPSMMLAESIESLRLLLDVAAAADAMRDDYERYGYVRNKGYVNPLHDEKILRAYDAALDKLREVSGGD